MPVYEFQCIECITNGSITASMNEEVKMTCPRCSKDMTRIYSAPGLILKGGGWGGKP